MAHLSISTTREGTDPPATDVVPDANLSTLGVLGWWRFGETASGDSNYRLGQLLLNTGFAGAVAGSPGTPPTGWTAVVSTGTRGALAALAQGSSATYQCTAQRLADAITVSVAANSVFCHSVEVLAYSGSISLQNVISCSSPPAGASIAYLLNGVAAAGTDLVTATGIIEAILTTAGTAGTVSARIGLGCTSDQTGSVTVAYPQFEVGSRRTPYNYNTSTTLAKAALWNGTIADIGSPAWGYYGGSNNKQASLTPYVDGFSPATSAGTRGYRTCNVAASGMRMTIPLLGQSIRMRLACGSYDGVFRVAASLSDSSAGAVTQDHTAGALAVGWWRTTILACATSDAANLVVDITCTSGGGFQFMGFYVDFGTPVIKSYDTATFHEGGTTVVQIAGFAILPLTANSLLAGLGITVSSATHLTATLTMPAESAFRFGGTHAAVKWLTDKTLTLANASESASATVQIQPQYSDQYAARSGDPAVNTLDTYNTDKVVALADPVYMWTDPVEMALIDAAVVDYSPYTGAPITIYGKFWDDSQTSWSSRTTWTFPTGSSLALTSADTTVTPGQVVRQTLTGGPFAAAITAAYLVYGAVEVPITWSVVSSTLTDVTIPSVDEFDAAADAEDIPWYGNFVIKLVAGAESAETPNTNQVVAVNAGDYGVVGAGPYNCAPAGTQEGDNAYMYLVSGAGTFTPESLDFTDSAGGSVIKSMVFNVASQKWLATTLFLVGFASMALSAVPKQARRLLRKQA